MPSSAIRPGPHCPSREAVKTRVAKPPHLHGQHQIFTGPRIPDYPGKEEGHTPVRRTSEGPAGAPRAPIPTSAGPTYQPDAPARVPCDFPRWRVGLVCASVRIFLAGVIRLQVGPQLNRFTPYAAGVNEEKPHDRYIRFPTLGGWRIIYHQLARGHSRQLRHRTRSSPLAMKSCPACELGRPPVHRICGGAARAPAAKAPPPVAAIFGVDGKAQSRAFCAVVVVRSDRAHMVMLSARQEDTLAETAVQFVLPLIGVSL